MMTRKEALALVRNDPAAAAALIVELSRRVKELEEETRRLRGLVEEHNTPSPLTPSGQIPVYHKRTVRRRRKKPGRKPGHPGAARRRPDHVDEVIDHPLDQCPCCGNALPGKTLGTRSHVVEDIPPDIKVKVIEHRIERKWCPVCKKIVEPVVDDTCPNSPVGLRPMVTSAFYHYFCGISIENVRHILSQLCGLGISKGGLSYLWARLADLVHPVYDEIGERARTSGSLNADETGSRVNGKTEWLWAFAGKDFCFFHIDRCRGSPFLKKFFKNHFAGILHCDFWGAYNRLQAFAKQRCFFHLFSELDKVDQRNHSPHWKAWCKKCERLLRDAVRLWKQYHTTTPQVYQRRTERLKQRLSDLLADDTYADDKDVARLLKRLRRHHDELFTFLAHPDVATPYNNHAERQLRPAVINRKVSQQNRSRRGAQTQAILMTLFRTLHLMGKPVVDTTVQICNLLKRRNISGSSTPVLDMFST